MVDEKMPPSAGTPPPKTGGPQMPDISMPPMPTSQGLMNDLKGMYTLKAPSFIAAAKNPSNLIPGVIALALIQVAYQFGQYRSVQEANELAAAFGLDLNLGLDFFIKSGVYGFVSALVFSVALYFMAIKAFKAKTEADVKGFVGTYGLLLLPMVLSVVPVLGLIGGVYVLVLVVSMIMKVFNFSVWKSIGVALLTALLVGIVLLPIAGALGIGDVTGDVSFDFSY